MPYSSSTLVTTIESAKALRGAWMSFHSSNSRFPFGWVWNSYARIIVRRSARACSAAAASSAAVIPIVILILSCRPCRVPISSLLRSVRLSAPALAVLAEAVQLQLVPRHLEAVVAGDHVLQLLDALVLELDDPVAAGADQVIVVMAADGGLVPRLPVLEVARAGEACVGEDLHGAVHGRRADVLVARLHLGEQLLDAEVPAGGEEGVDDQVPLPGRLEPPLGDPAREPLASRAAGRGGLRLASAAAVGGGTLGHVEIDSQSREPKDTARGDAVKGGRPSAQPPARPQRLAPFLLRCGTLLARRDVRPEQPHQGRVRGAPDGGVAVVEPLHQIGRVAGVASVAGHFRGERAHPRVGGAHQHLHLVALLAPDAQ